MADCIALYSLGCFASWPLDTHMITHAVHDRCLHAFLNGLTEHQEENGRPRKERSGKATPETETLKRKRGPSDLAGGEAILHTLTPAAVRSFLSAGSRKKGTENPKTGNVSDGLYYSIQGYYQRQLGLYAGWAQSGIFADALRARTAFRTHERSTGVSTKRRREREEEK